MVAANLVWDEEGYVKEALVAVGSCAPKATRLEELERALIGKRMGNALGEAVLAKQFTPLSPIDDVRGTASYRTDVAVTLVRRALEECARQGR